MADPLLAKLDRLMRQMERGQLLEDEQGDAPGGELDNGRRAPRRQRQQQAKPFKNWDSGSTSYKLPEYFGTPWDVPLEVSLIRGALPRAGR